MLKKEQQVDALESVLRTLLAMHEVEVLVDDPVVEGAAQTS
jgi:hypothetical protein